MFRGTLLIQSLITERALFIGSVLLFPKGIVGSAIDFGAWLKARLERGQSTPVPDGTTPAAGASKAGNLAVAPTPTDGGD